MRQTCLRACLGKHPIGGPSVADNRSAVLPPDQRFCLLSSATARNQIVRSITRGRRVQPSLVPSDAPSRLIGRQHRPGADLLADLVMKGFYQSGQSRQCPAECRCRNLDSERCFEKSGDPPVRHAAFLVQFRGQGDRARTNLHAGSPGGLRDLFRVSISNTAPAPHTSTDINLKLCSHCRSRGNVGLPLPLAMMQLDSPPLAVRTPQGYRNVNDSIHTRRPHATSTLSERRPLLRPLLLGFCFGWSTPKGAACLFALRSNSSILLRRRSFSFSSRSIFRSSFSIRRSRLASSRSSAIRCSSSSAATTPTPSKAYTMSRGKQIQRAKARRAAGFTTFGPARP